MFVCPIIGTVRVPFRSAPLAGGWSWWQYSRMQLINCKRNRTGHTDIQTRGNATSKTWASCHQPTASLEAAAVAAVFGVALSAPPPSEGGIPVAIPGHLANSDAKHVAPG